MTVALAAAFHCGSALLGGPDMWPEISPFALTDPPEAERQVRLHTLLSNSNASCEEPVPGPSRRQG